ncbi:site-specific recombinase [Bdellovibrio svalbardensis]|uniref:Site-specific recombinase n=1 Tax=Bdellovibrio svalbardensis TaxID=2972972 RepID=A0ABT6DHI3_9BACT|nr:site-specific recombinase [Bdellovibrio svalbardensis]MDG0816310.1 site-specific recombinase [Bdellovibrio svalbardensis]
MFRQLKDYFIRFRQYKRSGLIHSDLDVLLNSAATQRSLEDKLQWLVKLLQWVRYEGNIDAHIEKEAGKVPAARLRYLLMILDRNPTWKVETAKILRAVIKNVGGIELYTETGLPREVGVIGEVWDRLIMKMLPTPPLDHELGYLFWALFPDAKDPLWLASIDHQTFDKLVDLFNYEVAAVEGDWNRLHTDLEDALAYLVIQVRAIGLSPAFRHRLDKANFRDSAFFALVRGLEEFHIAYQENDRQVFLEKASRFRLLIWECRRELAQVHKHLDEFGVSINLVFQIARIQAYLKRVDSLVEILITEKLDAKKVTQFLATLVEENQELRSVKSLISQNVSLLARKVVERAAETGEHYITRTREEYRKMVSAAAGGGAITAITVYLKTGILALGLSGFMEGVFSSVNYALSFCVIHLAGFTLGTKQPAMTAPALAAKMQDVGTPEGMESLVDEIAHLIRSQVAAISGNVLMVVPVTLFIDAAFFFTLGKHVMSFETAHHAFEAVDVLGPAALYAAFTGILLWLSSLAAGWGDNWFALYSLRKTLARSPTLRTVFGKMNARRIAVFFEKNISGLLGNIVLGVMLGMTPQILRFVGISLDVRHVTLSSGSMGAAISVMGVQYMKTAEFWRAMIGILSVGVLNVSVSFGMALWVAIRARGIKTPQRRAIRKAVFKRLIQHPLSFLLPVGTTVAKSSTEGHGH